MAGGLFLSLKYTIGVRVRGNVGRETAEEAGRGYGKRMMEGRRADYEKEGDGEGEGRQGGMEVGGKVLATMGGGADHAEGGQSLANARRSCA